VADYLGLEGEENVCMAAEQLFYILTRILSSKLLHIFVVVLPYAFLKRICQWRLHQSRLSSLQVYHVVTIYFEKLESVELYLYQVWSEFLN
jgi:hypothetical protein